MITIKKNKNADTRSADHKITYDELKEANDSHRNDVYNVMTFLADKIIESGKAHDHTKKDYEKEQYKAFIEAQNDIKPFSESDWYKMHVSTERHHLFSNVVNDVNLIDILEMISDIICAAGARNNELINDIKIDSDILNKAIKNTIKLINNNITIKD